MTVTEGNSGTTNAIFTVTLGAVSGRPVTVDYATADSSATSPTDYTATTGQRDVCPGPDDADGHRARQRRPLRRGHRDLLRSTSPTRATRRSPTARAAARSSTTTAQPQLSINDVTVTGGQHGLRRRDVHRLAVAGQRPDGQRRLRDTATARRPPRRTSHGTGGSLVFTPGQTTRTFTVQVNGDLLDEIDESFTVTLSAARSTRRSPTTAASGRSPTTT